MSALRQHERDDLLTMATVAAARRVAESESRLRKDWAQYFTPREIAAYMAALLTDRVRGAVRLLDPGAGVGILGFAAAERLLDRGASSVELVSVEPERGASAELRQLARAAAARHGNRLRIRVLHDDFLEVGEGDLFGSRLGAFDFAIANPPYFKMSPADARGGNAPNIYARFMSTTAGLLKPGGRMCFIVPRSFASGLYFAAFRRALHAQLSLLCVHVFDSRRDAFRDQDVLQENIVVLYEKGAASAPDVLISRSAGVADLDASTTVRLPRENVVRGADEDATLFLPSSPDDLRVMALFNRWRTRLADLGLEISTGPVVPFRARSYLFRKPNGLKSAPLLWMQHVRPGAVQWPLGPRFRKEEHIDLAAPEKLFVRNATCVLLRRFSAKEQPRRLTAAALLAGAIPGDLLGLENHLNFVHRPRGDMNADEAAGLAALLNSRLADAYFRLTNGNTQVSATEIRRMPLPSRRLVVRLGRRMRGNVANLDQVVEEVLGVEGG